MSRGIIDGIPTEIHEGIWKTLETLAKFLKQFLVKSLVEFLVKFLNMCIKKSF